MGEGSEANPAEHGVWNGYAELCLYLEDQDAYEKACHRLLAHFGGPTTNPQVCERVGRACLLGVIPPADTSRAAELIELAVNTDLPPAQAWARSYFLVAQGLARYRLNDFDGAIKLNRRRLTESPRSVAAPCPCHGS